MNDCCRYVAMFTARRQVSVLVFMSHPVRHWQSRTSCHLMSNYTVICSDEVVNIPPKTRYKAKPGCSPPGYPPSRLLLLLVGQLTGSPAPNAALARLVVRRHLPNATRTQFFI